jgi:hypothetical protein
MEKKERVKHLSGLIAGLRNHPFHITPAYCQLVNQTEKLIKKLKRETNGNSQNL